MADEAAHSLSLLVEDLLDLSQIESDTLKLRHEPFELHRTLQRVVRMVRPQAQRNNLPIRLECSPRLPLWVVGDEFRLQQVLLNLLVNAVKFTHAGEIRLRATSADEPVIELMPYSGQTANGVIFEVMDTGVGIPEESQQLIFEKFTQLSPTAHEGTSGIGLGLSIAAQLVGLMNGHISVTSRVGKGSVFSVFLPLSSASASASASEVNGDHTTAKSILSSREEVQEPSCLNEANLFPPIASEDVRSEHYDQTANRRLRVLVADDTLVSRQVIQAMLASLGHEAKAVGDGMQALEAFLLTTYDAVLLDMQMPEWNGVRTAQELRKAERSAGRCRIPLLMLSATTERHGAGSDLFDAQLTKPVSLNVLQATLSRITAALQVNEGACQEDVLPSGTALQRMGGNRALFEEIYQAFFDQLPEQLRELRVAVEGQTDQVPVVAHRLSGQLLMLDFYEAAAVARSMEDVASRRHDIADASIQELLAHFESLLRQLPSPSF